MAKEQGICQLCRGDAGSVKVSAVRVSWRDIALYRVRFGDRIESLGCDSIVLNERALQLYAQRLR